MDRSEGATYAGLASYTAASGPGSSRHAARRLPVTVMAAEREGAERGTRQRGAGRDVPADGADPAVRRKGDRARPQGARPGCRPHDDRAGGRGRGRLHGASRGRLHHREPAVPRPHDRETCPAQATTGGATGEANVTLGRDTSVAPAGGLLT